MKFIFLLCVFSVFIQNKCYGANILVHILTPAYSHQMAYRPLWRELAKRGHRITLVTTNLMEENENITQIDLSEAYSILERHNIYSKLAVGSNVYHILFSVLDLYVEVLEYQLKALHALLRNETKFDLLFSEFYAEVGFALGEKFGIPSIGIVSMDGNYIAHDAVGNPSHPAIYPDNDLAFSNPLSFKERIISSVYSIGMRVLFKFILLPQQQKLLRKYFGEISPIEETLKRVSMLFINANPIFLGTRPLGPKTINIGGGFHFSEPKPLPQDFQDLLDTAEEGVIYFSLGTNIKYNHISNKTKGVILKTFSQLPYQILWTLEAENLPSIPSNVRIKKWAPQQDILRHKNIKLLITHGGLHSLEEAFFNHIPMIGLPFFGDQHNNVKKMVNAGFGLSFDHATLEIQTFKEAILEVIHNPKYKQRVKALADLVLDQPMTGLEKAVWWTEYVLRNGNTEHFRDPVVDIPLYQYYLLDVILFLFIVAIIAIFTLYYVIRYLWIVCTTMCSILITQKDIKYKIT